MKKLYKKLLVGFSGIGTLAIGASISAGIVIPLAKKQAKEKLGVFVSNGGPAVNFSKRIKENNNKLKIVALGDSVTAGYNGYLGRESYSYSDFLVNSIRNARTSNDNKIHVDYKNFAKSGLKLADIKTIFEIPELTETIKDADLIPITIGANDILSVLKLLHMPFYLGKTILSDADKILATLSPDGTIDQNATYKNEEDGKDYKIWNDIKTKTSAGSTPSQTYNLARNETNDVNLVFTKHDAKNMMDKTIQDIIEISSDNETISSHQAQFLNIDNDWVDTIFGLVERELTTLIRDIHIAAPKAQIVVLGHALPFAQFPDAVLNTSNQYTNNLTLMQAFNKLLTKMKKGSHNSLTSNDFVDFYKIDELSEVSPLARNLETGAKNASFKSVDYSTPTTYISTVKDNLVPNILDIHPTIYGHQLIGESLFKIYGAKLGFTQSEMQAGISSSKTKQSTSSGDFAKLDQKDSLLSNYYERAAIFDNFLSNWKNLPDTLLQNLKKSMDTLDSLTKLNSQTAIDSVYDELINNVVAYAKKLPNAPVDIIDVTTVTNILAAALQNSNPIYSKKSVKEMQEILKNTLSKIYKAYGMAKLKMQLYENNQTKEANRHYTNYSIIGTSAFISQALLTAQLLAGAQDGIANLLGITI